VLPEFFLLALPKLLAYEIFFYYYAGNGTLGTAASTVPGLLYIALAPTKLLLLVIFFNFPLPDPN
jgi:hypothetical protein